MILSAEDAEREERIEKVDDKKVDGEEEKKGGCSPLRPDGEEKHVLLKRYLVEISEVVAVGSATRYYRKCSTISPGHAVVVAAAGAALLVDAAGSEPRLVVNPLFRPGAGGVTMYGKDSMFGDMKKYSTETHGPH